jgi:hypothetical protein
MEREKMQLDAQANREKTRMQMAVEGNKAISTMMQSRAKVDAAKETEGEKRRTIEAKAATAEGGSGDVATPEPEAEAMPDLLTGFMQMLKEVSESNRMVAEAITNSMNAPVRAVKQRDGSWVRQTLQ